MVTFDTSIKEFAATLAQHGIDISERSGVFVRDVRGRLLFVARGPLASDRIDSVQAAIRPELQPYVSPLGAVADSATPGASHALNDKGGLRMEISSGKDTRVIVVLDRRAVGADWLHIPENLDVSPPRLVFSSLKGGVGRSTALSVLAADLAERGRSLLVLDLDLEAPGLGSMLIEPSATPRFGSVDFFVDGALQKLDEKFLIECVGSSWLGGGRGRIDVVPAFGATSLANPSEVLAKLARAYVEGEDDDGHPRTFLTRTQELVSRLSALRRYDAVLVDTRAGLHETTAASLLGLGADVLLFGVDQPQTHLGYRILLSHLARLGARAGEDDWRYRLRMVQAKAESPAAIATYRARMFDLFEEVFYDRPSASGADPLEEGFRFGVDDEAAPHYPVCIFEDERYHIFDPIQNRAQLTKNLYEKSFDPFIRFCAERLQLEQDTSS